MKISHFKNVKNYNPPQKNVTGEKRGKKKENT